MFSECSKNRNQRNAHQHDSTPHQQASSVRCINGFLCLNCECCFSCTAFRYDVNRMCSDREGRYIISLHCNNRTAFLYSIVLWIKSLAINLYFNEVCKFRIGTECQSLLFTGFDCLVSTFNDGRPLFTYDCFLYLNWMCSF